MKKSELHRIIERYLTDRGYCREGTRYYSLLSEDRSVKFIIQVPDMTRGFIVGVQLNDYGDFDGDIKHALLRCYQHDSLLAFAKTYDYTDEEICVATEKVCADIGTYVPIARAKLVEQLEFWVINQAYEQEKILSAIGYIPPDPYSPECLTKKAKELVQREGFMSFSYEEYYAHKEFYDQYMELGCKIILDDTIQRVMIMGQ